MNNKPTYDAYYYAALVAKILPRQNGTPSQVEALKKSLERRKGL